MAETWDWDSIFAELKKNAMEMLKQGAVDKASGLSDNVLQGIVSFFGPLGFIVNTILDKTGIRAQVSEQLGEAANNFIGKVAPDLSTATNGVKTAINTYFTANDAKLGLKDPIKTIIRDATQAVALQFLGTKIPTLDVAGYTKLASLRGALLPTIDANLPAETPNRAAEIERLLTAITGLQKGIDINNIAQNKPTSGLAGLLMQVAEKGATEGALATVKFDIVPNAPLLAGNVTNPGVTGGNPGKNPKAPPGIKPDKTSAVTPT